MNIELDMHDGILNLAKVELIKLSNQLRKLKASHIGIACNVHKKTCLNVTEGEIENCICVLNRLYNIQIKKQSGSGKLGMIGYDE